MRATMASETEAQELDEDGLIVQRYDRRVLVAVPPRGFGDQTLRYARSSLYNIHVGTWVAASDPDTPVAGRLQDEFLADGSLDDVSLDEFAGVIVVGCEGEHPFTTDQRVLTLLREAHAAHKLVAGWGNAAAVLAAAGVVRGRRITGDAPSKAAVERAGGKFTGRQVEPAGHIVTASDEGAGMRFGQALVEAVRIL